MQGRPFSTLRSSIGRAPRGSCNNAPFSEGFLEGFSTLLFEKVLRRVLRCLPVGFNEKKGSEKGS